ncbi:deoxyhypusine synthase [Amylocarpus encephaloides]|uniref:Deoxyhypusine synthase n=1 Tax=Amylocarpus encephaloides TaxID=45428 RepID=A0A9P8C1F5_9HELO|nr:deoxyhypusine synthase [Amylocarpus encephaloides]
MMASTMASTSSINEPTNGQATAENLDAKSTPPSLPETTANGAPPPSASSAVLVRGQMPAGSQGVEELDFNKFAGRPITVDDLLTGMNHMGFQASSIGEAVRIINDMRAWRDPESSAKTTIFLGYTSNLISSGLRGTLRYLAQHNHISAIVTTAGGIEEDLIKCLGNTYMGSFSTPGAGLRAQGLNRIGNLIVPNDNYCKFEDWVLPILDTLLAEQSASKADPRIPDDEKLIWTPSKIIHRLGLEINDESSVLYWAAKNNIPIFCPALTDGSLGDMLYFHSFKCSPQRLVMDTIQDLRKLNSMAVRAKRAGMIILGGGIVKHHIANACLMRNGAESAVYINTAQEFDGSDAGARPDEAVSWGKIKAGADTVKVYVEATACFPLIVAGTFANDAS